MERWIAQLARSMGGCSGDFYSLPSIRSKDTYLVRIKSA